MKDHVSNKLREAVRDRAANRCEYCQLPQEASLLMLEIDHIIPEVQGGPTELPNLALACRSCNSYKGYHISKHWYESGKTVMLFNPRTAVWSEHFSLAETGVIASLTETGLATVIVLNLNEQIRVEGRMLQIQAGQMTPTTKR